ncbi:hypothetical protein EI555_014755, partial [Monodon monoceros]
GFRSLVVTTLTLFLVFSFMGNSNSAPQRLFERRNWTPQAMLYLKGARTFQILCSSDSNRGRSLIKEKGWGAGVDDQKSSTLNRRVAGSCPKGDWDFQGHTAPPWLVSEIAAPSEAHSGARGRGACGLYPWSPPSSAPAPQPGQFRAHRAPPAPDPGTPIDRAGWALSPCLALAEGRRFISDQSRRKDLADRPPP